MPDTPVVTAGDRLAKVIARAGVCSRRDAEGWIRDGRIAVNGKVVRTPAFNVGPADTVTVDGAPLAARSGTRLWLYHKPPGLVVTEKDTEGRETVFEQLAELGLPRVLSVGRLDINTEGLLLLTNDGGLKRVLELPSTGWMRRYRVRAFGQITQAQLDVLKDGIEVEGVQYGPIEASLERSQGANSWLLLGLREGKNREVKTVLAALGLQVNRLIRVSYGPFQLGELAPGKVEAVPARVLREQLGRRLAREAGADFDSDMPEVAAQKRRADPAARATAPDRKSDRNADTGTAGSKLRPRSPAGGEGQRPARPGTPRRFGDRDQPRAGRSFDRDSRDSAPRAPRARKIHFEDGRTEEVRPQPDRRDRFGQDDRPRRDAPGRGPRPSRGAHSDRDDRPRRGRDDARPATDRPDAPRRVKPASGGPERPFKPRSSGPRPSGPGDKRSGPGAARSGGPRTSRPQRPDAGGAPRSGRPTGSAPRGARPAGGPRPSRGPGGSPKPGGSGRPRPPRKPRS